MKIKAAIILCTISLMAMTGCGEKAGEPVMVDVEKTDLSRNLASEGGDEPEAEDFSKEEAPDKDTAAENGEAEDKNAVKENTEELEGTVKSIENTRLVVSKIFTEEEDGVLLAVQPAEGSEDEVLITVSFSENVKYELHTVKNNGVNGDSDVTKTEASFSDLKEQVGIKLSGYYITPDKEFMADSVIIYNFV